MNDKECTRQFKMGIPMGARMPCYQAKVSCTLSQHMKQPQQESVALSLALEPPKAPSPCPFQGPAQKSSRSTLKVLVTPAKQAPSLGPGPSTSKKAKASVSKSRLKMPSITQKAKFALMPSSDPKDHIIKGLEVQVASLKSQVQRIPDLELQVSSLAQVVEALWEQVQGQLATHSFPTSSHRSLPLPASVSRQMQRLHLEMTNFHPQFDFLTLEAEG
ncbi:hypothetical protein PAXRUDRAFT_18234 [Paxillus rubicundulus Ve08.2h10]|uniref:Uncharacterized protein n=1 Tax=Paxillus rubicundulus Ve08.2h10 TaxID=930991 RepID=A0A0D0CYW9_9AGAM|nr:hypothetical protein PAXRUDRAFT_18234 [Paxillus rubicundulus Ve08.2h10]